MNATRRRKLSGFTVVELLTGAAIAATLASQALPAFRAVHERQRLLAVSESLGAELREARAWAQSHGRTLTVRFPNSKSAQCFVVHTGSRDDCECSATGAPICTADAVALKTFKLPAASGLSLSTNRQSLTFSSRLGQSNMGTIALRASNGATLKQIVALTGRIRTCGEGQKMSGIPAC